MCRWAIRGQWLFSSFSKTLSFHLSKLLLSDLPCVGGRREASEFASRFSLSESSLEAVAQGRGEYATTLEELGFLPFGCASGIRIQRGGGGGRSGKGSSLLWRIESGEESIKTSLIVQEILGEWYQVRSRFERMDSGYKSTLGKVYSIEDLVSLPITNCTHAVIPVRLARTIYRYIHCA